MDNIKNDIEKRVLFIKDLLKKSGASGIVYGNSGGKDCTLASILCKMACDNTKGVIMPCGSKQNYNSDKDDALKNANKFNIENIIVDLTSTKEEIVKSMQNNITLNADALTNIAPRLRMTTLYSVAAAENRLVCGTGNKSEAYMGYFTKWGDGAHDFNPISDLTVTEIFEYLKVLCAPESIINKAPSAGLFDGQTDENEMGVTYKEIDIFISNGEVSKQSQAIIERYHSKSNHKRTPIITYK